MIFFLTFKGVINMILVPLEMKLMKREYFNRWYGLKAYYTALTVSTLPLMVSLCIQAKSVSLSGLKLI